MLRGYAPFALIALFFIIVSCVPQAPTPDPLATQVAVALAVNATLTALAPTSTAAPAVAATETPKPTNTSRPTSTPYPTWLPPSATPVVPTVDPRLRQFTDALIAIMGDDNKMADEWNAWQRSGGSGAPETDIAKFREFYAKVQELADRVSALDTPPAGRSLRDNYLASLSGRQRFYQLVESYARTGDLSFFYQANREMEEANRLRRVAHDQLQDLLSQMSS